MLVKTKEDLIQEALLIIYNNYKTMTFEKGILPWAYTILDNVIKGDYIKECRRDTLLSEHQHQATKGFGTKETTDETCSLHDLDDEIKRAFKKLKKKERTILKLKLEGYSSHEIQQKMGLTRTALDVSVHRCRKKLKQLLESRGAI